MGKRADKRKAEADDMKRVVEEAISQLTPEQAAEFERQMARANKRRLIMLAGYILSLFVLIAGSLWAFYVYGTAEPGSFRAWVFLVPLAVMGVIFVFAGRLARRYGS